MLSQSLALLRHRTQRIVRQAYAEYILQDQHVEDRPVQVTTKSPALKFTIIDHGRHHTLILHGF